MFYSDDGNLAVEAVNVKRATVQLLVEEIID